MCSFISFDVQLHLFPSFTILSVSHAQCSTTCVSSCLLLSLAWWTRTPCHFAVFNNLLSAPFTNLPDKIVVVLLTCLFYMCMSSSSYVKRTWERTVLKCHNLDWQNWTAMFQSPAPVQNWTRLSSHSSRSADLVCVFDVPACLCEFICKPFLSVRKIQNVSSAIGYWLLFSSTNVWQVNQV